MKIQIQCQQA